MDVASPTAVDPERGGKAVARTGFVRGDAEAGKRGGSELLEPATERLGREGGEILGDAGHVSSGRYLRRACVAHGRGTTGAAPAAPAAGARRPVVPGPVASGGARGREQGCGRRSTRWLSD